MAMYRMPHSVQETKSLKDEECGSCLLEETDLCIWKAKIQYCKKIISISFWHKNMKEQTNRSYISSLTHIGWSGGQLI